MSELKDPRVLFAAERTLLAWSRTSLGFIAFGFLIERSGLLLSALSPSSMSPGAATRTFWLGLAFVALGIFAVFYSSRQHMVFLKTLNPHEIPTGYRTRGGLIVNGVVAILGAILAAGLYLNRVG